MISTRANFISILVGCGGWSSGAQQCWYIQAKSLWLGTANILGRGSWDVDEVQREDVRNADSTQAMVPAKLPAESGWQTLWSSSGEPANQPSSVGHPCTGMCFLTLLYLCIPYIPLRPPPVLGKPLLGKAGHFFLGVPACHQYN